MGRSGLAAKEASRRRLISSRGSILAFLAAAALPRCGRNGAAMTHHDEVDGRAPIDHGAADECATRNVLHYKTVIVRSTCTFGHVSLAKRRAAGRPSSLRGMWRGAALTVHAKSL
jgi:hypothetical protein